MEREKLGQRVGMFVLLAMGLLGVVVAVLGSKQDLFAQQYVLYAEFADVAGLQAGAPIRLSGVDIGQVGEISFPENRTEKSLRVRLQIRENVRDRIREDSKASIATQGVLGDKYIAITLGTVGEPLHTDTTLASDSPTDYGAIVDTASRTMAHVESIAGKFDALFTPAAVGSKETASVLQNLSASASDLRAATKDMRDIVGKVDRGEGTVGALINDPALYEDLRKLLGGAKKSVILRTAVRHAVSKNKDDEPEPKADDAPAP